MCECVCGVPMTDAKSSGAELPAAMKVAPATSSLRSNFCRNKTKFRGLYSLHTHTQTTHRVSAASTDEDYDSYLPHRSSPAMSRSIHRMLWREQETCRVPRDRTGREV